MFSLGIKFFTKQICYRYILFRIRIQIFPDSLRIFPDPLRISPIRIRTWKKVWSGSGLEGPGTETLLERLPQRGEIASLKYLYHSCPCPVGHITDVLALDTAGTVTTVLPVAVSKLLIASKERNTFIAFVLALWYTITDVLALDTARIVFAGKPALQHNYLTLEVTSK